MFNPALGTFINLDPLESGSNFYAYCGDAPTDATDPTGEQIELLVAEGIMQALEWHNNPVDVQTSIDEGVVSGSYGEFPK